MGMILDICNRKTQPANELSLEQEVELKLKLSRDMIKNYQRNIKAKIDKNKLSAKKNLADGNRVKAQQLLKLNKMFQSQIDACEGQLTMLVEQIDQIRTMKNRAEIMRTLDEGNKILKKMQQDVDIEKWEEIVDDMEELKEKQNEISDFLKEKGVEYDDEDMDKEIKALEELMGNEAAVEFPEANQGVKKEKATNQKKEKVLVEG